ncbi:MAG: hypothetical protein ACRD68_03270, partial [Pyrinomonadaceae bacterium]
MHRVATRTLFFSVLLGIAASSNYAQAPAPRTYTDGAAAAAELKASGGDVREFPAGGALAAEDVRRQSREQGEEIERLRATLREQMRLLDELRSRVERTEAASATVRRAVYGDTPVAATAAPEAGPAEERKEAQGPQISERLERVEEQARKTGESLSKQL